MHITSIEVINAVGEHYDLLYSQIVGRSRRYKIVEARRIAIYLSDKLGNEDREELADRFNRTYETIVMSIQKVKDMLANRESETLACNSLEIYGDLIYNHTGLIV